MRANKIRRRLLLLFWSVQPCVSWLSLNSVVLRMRPRRRFLIESSGYLFGACRTRLYYDTNNGRSVEGSSQIGFNELHTLLRDAVEVQNFVEAGRISNMLLQRLYPDFDGLPDDEKRQLRKRMGWKGLGAAPWLTERLDALNYTFPTTIQINAMQAVNAILSDDLIEETSLEERIDMHQKDMGIVISGTTGSGKSLAYLVPLLSTLSDSLFRRQRLRVGAEENVGDTTGDLLDRVAMVTSPMMRSNARKQTKRNVIATGAAMASLGGASSKDVKSPLAVIVVPTRELGVQTALVLYELIGGNIKESATEQSSVKANMFKYKGPKGIRIGCILDDEEASYGLKLQTDIAITTPQYLGKLINDGDLDPSKLRVIVYDEADLALEQTSEQTLVQLFDDDPDEREYTRLTYLVGASVTESLGNLAVRSRVLPEERSYIATATRFAPLASGGDASSDNVAQITQPASQQSIATLQDLNVCLYPGLRHERVVVQGDTGLLAVTRLLRRELQRYDEAIARGDTKAQRPRVVVFFPDEVQAKAAIEPLRDALWGEHLLCVLLPKTGVSPLSIMDQFKRSKTSVMLATPNSVRGLDFPALTHVYTLYLPMDDPREYVHLAGRVGRVGQVGSVLGDGGHVVSVLQAEDAHKMEELAQTLGFDFVDLDVPTDTPIKGKDGDMKGSDDVDRMRRYLEDTMTLIKLADDVEIDGLSVPAFKSEDVIDAEVLGTDDDDEEDDDDDDSSTTLDRSSFQ